jgi:hypothetical protein
VGPPFKQWDLAIYKNTKISERLGMQLRAGILQHLEPSELLEPTSAGVHC